MAGPPVVGHSPTQIAQQLLAAFERHHVPQVYGFINGAWLEIYPEDRAVLSAWVAAGYPLGNHTWAHNDLHCTRVPAFLDAISRNEPLLHELQPGLSDAVWRVFRYPYLHEGASLEVREQVRRHLRSHGYRIAHVTVDPRDWAYDAAYARCANKGSADALSALRATFLSEARAELLWADAEARRVMGRPIRHVLLLHLGVVDADVVEQLLEDYEKLGVRWVSFDEASADPMYQEDPHPAEGGSFLTQILEARGAVASPEPEQPMKLFDVVCE
jgi:peptidoglycan/xylan/chitin deacetylase (PgdA/CDA1 family)